MSKILTPGLPAERIRAAEESVGNASAVNVGPTERLVSGLGGAALLAAGLKRRGPSGAALALLGGMVAYRGATGYCSMYANLGVETAGKRRTEAGAGVQKGVLVRESCTINRPAAELYQFCRDFENLPRFMKHVRSVQNLDNQRSRWTVQTPIGGTVTSDAVLVNDKPNELIAWQTTPESQMHSAGSLRFRPAPGNRGTEVTMEYNFEPPAGIVGLTVAKLLGQSPDSRLREDLRRFKQFMEAGEIATVEGQTSCRQRR